MGGYGLVDEIPIAANAADIFALLHGRPFSFFLDSGMDPQNLGRYSFIGIRPFLVLTSRGDSLTFLTRKGAEHRKGNPFDALRRLLSEYSLGPRDSPLPLSGGAVGYLSYDLCHFVEHLPCKAIDDLQLPESCLAFYDSVLAFDHLKRKAYIACSGFPEQEEHSRLRTAARRMKELKGLLSDLLSRSPGNGRSLFVHEHPPTPNPVSAGEPRPNFTRQEYVEAVQKARDYIAAGDIFQVNLSQRFETDFPGSPYHLYRRLRRINPAPFAAYLNFGPVTVLSASPERFLLVNGDRVETRPMKGTRPRGSTVLEDEALARELVHSAKDRAENVMIVDLERNDLGKVCHFGSVRLKELWTLEKYATVFQLTSTVEGRLQSGRNRIDLLEACFPGGSITGAPKVRAMEIIDELEPTRRSIYTGCIGYFSFSGEMDTNIAIRTILIKGRKAYFQVGGGITYDSDPEAEYQETIDKARALVQSLSPSPDTAVLT